jgi:GT2 family glycosyltransferase
MALRGEPMSPGMRVSVVIPTYRRPDLLARCLAALAAQTFDPAEYEILVCDDANVEGTRQQVEALARTVRPTVRYLPVTGHHGPAAARNVGWRSAGSPVIAFMDDDTIPDPHWLAAAGGVFDRDPDLAAVTGQVIVPLPPRPTDYERNESGLATAEFVTANCFVRRTALEAVGGFDERFRAAWREDSDLQFNLLERGLKVLKVPEAVVVHPVRPARWGVSLRQQRKCVYDALLYRKHPELYRRRIPGPPWDYYGIVLAVVIAAGCLLAGAVWPALVAGLVWLTLTVRFLARRLRGTSRRPGHVIEMAVTSVAIPFLSIFWRLRGAVRFRVWFL